MNLRPDPTYYASTRIAMQAPVENYAFTVMLRPGGSQSDGIAVVAGFEAGEATVAIGRVAEAGEQVEIVKEVLSQTTGELAVAGVRDGEVCVPAPGPVALRSGDGIHHARRGRVSGVRQRALDDAKGDLPVDELPGEE